MKRCIFIIGAVMIATSLSANPYYSKATGIILRGSYWQTDSDGSTVSVHNRGFSSSVDIDSYGGSITFFSRTSDRIFVECSLGGSARVHTVGTSFFDEEVNVDGIAPFVFGIQYILLSGETHSAMQPYLVGGGGPYWESLVTVNEQGLFDEEVSIHTRLYPGVYLGGGTHFMASNTFFLNFDMRYHFVNFDPGQRHSGFQFSMGFGFIWGSYSS